MTYLCDCGESLDDPLSYVEHAETAHELSVSLRDLPRPTFITQLEARGVNRPREIACRRCARDTRCVDGLWRHVDDDTLACVNPATMQPQGEPTVNTTAVITPTGRPSRKLHRDWFKSIDASAKRDARTEVGRLVDDEGLTEAQAWSTVYDRANEPVLDEIVDPAPVVAEPAAVKPAAKPKPDPAKPSESVLQRSESTPASASKAARTSFFLNDKPKRGLSDVAYDGTRNMIDGQPRMTAAQFKQWLIDEHKLDNPSSCSYTLTLPNGNVVRVEHVAPAASAAA